MVAAASTPQTAIERFREFEAPDRTDDGPGRAVKAWLAGCAVAALTGWWAQGILALARGVDGAGAFILTMAAALPGATGLAALAVFLTCVPAPLLVLAERGLHLRRGLADIVLFALLAALMAQLFGLPVLDGLRGLALTWLAALCGGMGGLAYWLAAGRPQ